MRATFILLAAFAALTVWPSAAAALPSSPDERPAVTQAASTAQDPPKAPDIDIQITKKPAHQDVHWYADPMSIGLVLLGLIVIALIVGTVTRGTGGTTVVRQ